MMVKIDFEKLKSQANSDSEFLLSGRYWDARVQIVIGAEATRVADCGRENRRYRGSGRTRQ